MLYVYVRNDWYDIHGKSNVNILHIEGRRNMHIAR